MTQKKGILVLGGTVLAGAVTAWLLATVAFAEPSPPAKCVAPGVGQPGLVQQQACPWATPAQELPAAPEEPNGNASPVCSHARMQAAASPSCTGNHRTGMMNHQGGMMNHQGGMMNHDGGMMMSHGMMHNRMHEDMSGCAGMQATCHEAEDR